MNTVYLQHTYHAVSVGPTGHNHIRSPEADTKLPWGIECDACAPYLVKEFAGTYKVEQVPPTDEQIAEQERIEREGNLAVRQAAQQLAEAAGVLVGTKAAHDGAVVAKRRAGRPRKNT